MRMDSDLQYKVLQHPMLASTNTHLINLLASGEPLEEFTVVLTDEQTSGRGQGTNRWSSQGGKNLTFSTLFLPDLDAREHFFLNMCVSLGIRDTVEKYTEGVQVKWPNDIYVGKDKICGILIESSIKGGRITRCVAGIGLNVNQEEFESWIPNPTSIRNVTGKETDLTQLLDETMRNLYKYYTLLKQGLREEIKQEYLAHMWRKDLEADYQDANGRFTGIIRGCDDMGRLQIERPDGSVSCYAFREVSFIL